MANTASRANPSSDPPIWPVIILALLVTFVLTSLFVAIGNYGEALHQADLQAAQTWAGALQARQKFLQQLDLCDGRGAYPWSGSCAVVLAQQNQITSEQLQGLTQQALAQERRVHRPWILNLVHCWSSA
jgi:hypothetical protein